jgi:hypothetical protein
MTAIVLTLGDTTYAATRVPNPHPFEDAADIVSHEIDTPNGVRVVSTNVRSVTRTGGTVETHLQEFLEHEARIAAKHDTEGAGR